VAGARRSELRAACWLATLTAATTLLAASLYLFSWRYQLPALVAAPIAGALGLTAMFHPPETSVPADGPA
jgi:hypothetical protein